MPILFKCDYFPKYWNHGYCTEICRRLLDYGFMVLKLDEIIAIVRPENAASIRVIEKLNMRYTWMEEHYGMQLKRYAINREQYTNQQYERQEPDVKRTGSAGTG